MKKYLKLLLFLSLTLYAQKTHIPLTYQHTQPILESINQHAIIMGSGQKDIYVFIDPMCPYSRKFMRLVAKNETLLLKYQYHLFLYEIPRLKSKNVINHIYTSAQPLKSLLDIMVYEQKSKQDKSPSKTIQKSVLDIKQVAKSLGISTRPFIIIDEGRN